MPTRNSRSRHGGHVQTIAAGHYTVTGLSRHVRLGEFVAHKSATGIHLGEVVEVEPETGLSSARSSRAIRSASTIPSSARAPSAYRRRQSWCGRTINSLGEPIDGRGPLIAGRSIRRSISNTAPPSMTRKRVENGFRTGVRAIDIFSPLCLGQRLGIFAGSGVGKSTLLSMLARADAFDKVVIALVGERGREVREFIEDTLGDNMSKSIAVVATSDESPMLRKMAPLTAITIAEHFRDQGDNVLLIVDSVTRFAHAIREVATASGEPPIARGYPASVFTELPRLLERAGPGRRRHGHDHRDHLDPRRWRQPQRPDRRFDARHSRRPYRPGPQPRRRGPLSADQSAGLDLAPCPQGLDAGSGKAGLAAEVADPSLRGNARPAADRRLSRRAAIRTSTWRSSRCRSSTMF